MNRKLLCLLCCILVVFFSCKKSEPYEEGPLINWFIKDKDIHGRWRIIEAKQNETDITPLFIDSNQFVLNFTYDKAFKSAKMKDIYSFKLFAEVKYTRNDYTSLANSIYFWDDPYIVFCLNMSEHNNYYAYRHRWKPLINNKTTKVKILRRKKEEMKWECEVDNVKYVFKLKKIFE